MVYGKCPNLKHYNSETDPWQQMAGDTILLCCPIYNQRVSQISNIQAYVMFLTPCGPFY